MHRISTSSKVHVAASVPFIKRKNSICWCSSRALFDSTASTSILSRRAVAAGYSIVRHDGCFACLLTVGIEPD